MNYWYTSYVVALIIVIAVVRNCIKHYKESTDKKERENLIKIYAGMLIVAVVGVILKFTVLS